MTAYTDYVKKYAAEHKITYKEAMKAASASYKESVGKGVEEPAPVEVPKVEPVKVEVPAVALEVSSSGVKPKRVRASKAKGIVTKMLDEDAGGAQHIYPLDVVKVLKMDIK